jgi:hypothetical protein
MVGRPLITAEKPKGIHAVQADGAESLLPLPNRKTSAEPSRRLGARPGPKVGASFWDALAPRDVIQRRGCGAPTVTPVIELMWEARSS